MKQKRGEMEMEASLVKIWDLHDKLSDTIHSISRAHFFNSINFRNTDDFNSISMKKTEFESNGNQLNSGFVYVKELNVNDNVDDAKSLNAIRTALENLEDQLQFYHNLQSQQSADRDAALSQLESTRIKLAMRLAEYQGKKYRVIEQAQALVEEVCKTGQFVSPENPKGPASSPQDEELVVCNSKRLNALFSVLFSSFNSVRKFLKMDQVGGILGNSALVAISMLALVQLQQVGSKNKLYAPTDQEDIAYKQNLRKFPSYERSSSGHLTHLDVCLAKG